MPDTAPDTQPSATLPETRTPEQWADVAFPASPRGMQHPERWRHACASHLHRWELHEYHQGAPLKLTREDYDAALEASVSGHDPTPHAPALGLD